MSKIPLKFYCRDTETVAREILGLHLVHVVNGQKIIGKIVETEAYIGAQDRACHGFANRRTDRTEIMFQSGGSIYVFLIYGMYYCFNIVTGKKDEPTAVLIRALEPVQGIPDNVKTNGPGKLCRALHIDKSLNKKLMTSSEIYLETGSVSVKPTEIIASPRIGVDYAKECAAWLLRFYLKGNPHVSNLGRRRVFS